MKVQFLGAMGGRVTGSCTYFQYDRTETKFLVDCGLVQGEPHSGAMNAQPFPFSPSELKFVLLTHAHIDHCGLIPRLYKEGFCGSVICTRATAELTKISLEDASKYSKNLFSYEDVRAVSFQYIDDHPKFGLYRYLPIDQDLMVAFTRTAHILGATSLSISWLDESEKTKVITMTGDVGNNTKNNPYQTLLAHKQPPPSNSNYIVCESTYGDRPRDSKYQSHHHRIETLSEILEKESFENERLIVIPAFAIHRTQEVLLDVCQILSTTGRQSFGRMSKRPISEGTEQSILKNKWTKEQQSFIENILKHHPEAVQNQWQSLITSKTVNAGKKKKTSYFFTEEASDNAAQELIAVLLSLPIPEKRIVHIDSKMAIRTNKTYRIQLNKRQKRNNDELLYRNRFLPRHFELPDELALDRLMEEILPELKAEDHVYDLGPHRIIHRTSAAYSANRERYNKILITGGGMCDGGPIMENLEDMLRNPNVCFILTGFMASNTAGAAIKKLVDKRQEDTKQTESKGTIMIPLPNDRALHESEVHAKLYDLSPFYSGHADQTELVNHLLCLDDLKFTDSMPDEVTLFCSNQYLI